MMLSSMLKTLKGNYYTEVNIDNQLSLNADTDYLRALVKEDDPRTKLEVKLMHMDIFKRHTGEQFIYMHINLKQ